MMLSKDEIELLKTFRDEICNIDDWELELEPILYNISLGSGGLGSSQSFSCSSRKSNSSFLPDIEFIERIDGSSEHQFRYFNWMKRPQLKLNLSKTYFKSFLEAANCDRFEQYTLIIEIKDKREATHCLYFRGELSLVATYQAKNN